MLNHPPGNPYAELDLLYYTPEDSSMSYACPKTAEVREAIKRLCNGRASGLDSIPPELLKVVLDLVSVGLHALIKRVWSTGLVPSEWCDGNIVSLYKGKGSRVECSSYRPVTLLLVLGNVLSHVLLARLRPPASPVVRIHARQIHDGRHTFIASPL